MALGVVGPLADPLRAIDQALLDVVADVPPRLVGKRGDLAEGEFLGGAHGLLIRQCWWRVKWRVLFAHHSAALDVPAYASDTVMNAHR